MGGFTRALEQGAKKKRFCSWIRVMAGWRNRSLHRYLHKRMKDHQKKMKIYGGLRRLTEKDLPVNTHEAIQLVGVGGT